MFSFCAFRFRDTTDRCHAIFLLRIAGTTYFKKKVRFCHAAPTNSFKKFVFCHAAPRKCCLKLLRFLDPRYASTAIMGFFLLGFTEKIVKTIVRLCHAASTNSIKRFVSVLPHQEIDVKSVLERGCRAHLVVNAGVSPPHRSLGRSTKYHGTVFRPRSSRWTRSTSG